LDPSIITSQTTMSVIQILKKVSWLSCLFIWACKMPMLTLSH
jgi:hypothetical protein